jgi:hypothetical protein
LNNPTDANLNINREKGMSSQDMSNIYRQQFGREQKDLSEEDRKSTDEYERRKGNKGGFNLKK